MIQLKDLTLRSRIIQSPMAGCTDLAFRLIARECGMEFAFLEMVSAEALVRQAKKTFRLMKSVEQDSPLGAQLVGCDPETMGKAAAIVEEMGYDLIDINFGCPVPKITAPGGGSALLKEPEKAEKIFKNMVKNVKKVPITVKMRLGFNDASGDEAIRISQIAEDAGLVGIAVHGRTRSQGYTGSADWKAIGRVKQSVSLPVFGNGDVTNSQEAKKMLEESGCDGVMIGRGALGNPWIYKEIEHDLFDDSVPRPEPKFEDVKAMALKHLDLEVEIEGEVTGVLKSRRILCWYFKNLPGSRELRNHINRATKHGEMRSMVEDYEPKNFN